MPAARPVLQLFHRNILVWSQPRSLGCSATGLLNENGTKNLLGSFTLCLHQHSTLFIYLSTLLRWLSLKYSPCERLKSWISTSFGISEVARLKKPALLHHRMTICFSAVLIKSRTWGSDSSVICEYITPKLRVSRCSSLFGVWIIAGAKNLSILYFFGR